MIFKGHSIRDSTGENPNFKGHQALLSTELDQNKGQPELRTVGVGMQTDYVKPRSSWQRKLFDTNVK